MTDGISRQSMRFKSFFAPPLRHACTFYMLGFWVTALAMCMDIG